jgi:uncharacterized phage protein (TIGR01671 family)
MRTIKFRAWDKKQQKMVFFSVNNSGIKWLSNFDSIDEDRGDIMQYTGLTDRNGKEIYEGDIIQSGKYNKVKRKPTPSIVFLMETHAEFQHKWNEGSICNKSGEFWMNEPLWKIACSMTIKPRCEVIGNIYENPELLNK